MAFLVLLVLLMPYEKNPYLKLASSFLGVIQDFTVIKALGMAAAVWALHALLRSPLPVFRSHRQKLFCGFMIIAVLSGVLAANGAMFLTKYLGIVALYPVVLAALRTPRNVVVLLEVCAISILVSAFYAFRQVARFGASVGQALTDPNYYSAIILLTIPVVAAVAALHRKSSSRHLWRGAVLVLVLAVLMSGSRGGLLGLIVLIPLLVTQLPRKRRVLALAIAGILMVATLLWLPTNIGQRLHATFDPETSLYGVRVSTENHLELVLIALRMIESHWLTGIGLGNFKLSSVAYSESLTRAYIAHNSYLEIGAELGLPALALYLLLLYSTIRSLRRCETRAVASGDRTVALISRGMRHGLLAFLVPAFFISAQYEKFLWLFIFASMSLERLLDEAPVRSRSAKSLAEAGTR